MSAVINRSGVGCERDTELERGVRLNARTYLMGNKEKRELLLGLSDSLRHRDFQQGDLMSELDGKIVPLTLDFPFAGICEAVGQDPRGRYVASVVTRGIVVLRVEGVSQPVRQGTLVYASPTQDHRCAFTVDGTGVLIGEVTNCEVTLSGNVKVHVGLRVPGDSRPYSSGSLSDPFKS
jgi:hypothetical protein